MTMRWLVTICWRFESICPCAELVGADGAVAGIRDEDTAVMARWFGNCFVAFGQQTKTMVSL